MIIYGNRMHDNVIIFSHTAVQAYLHTDSLSLCVVLSLTALKVLECCCFVSSGVQGWYVMKHEHSESKEVDQSGTDL